VSDAIRGYAEEFSLLRDPAAAARLPNPRAHSTQLSTAKGVLMYLAGAANPETRVAQYSLNGLASASLLARTTVRRAIDYLVAIGEVHVEWGGMGHTSVSTFTFPRFETQREELLGPDTPDAEVSVARTSAGRSDADHALRSVPASARQAHMTVENPVDNQPASAHEVLAASTSDPPLNRNARAEVKPLLTSGGRSLQRESEAGQADQSQGKGRRQATEPPQLRPPDDPFIHARAREIRAAQGDAQAMAYLRTVSDRWQRASQSTLLAQLERIGRMPT
jgi:hypothetical protein